MVFTAPVIYIYIYIYIRYRDVDRDKKWFGSFGTTRSQVFFFGFGTEEFFRYGPWYKNICRKNLGTKSVLSLKRKGMISNVQ
jgi:hypothetical protein